MVEYSPRGTLAYSNLSREMGALIGKLVEEADEIRITRPDEGGTELADLREVFEALLAVEATMDKITRETSSNYQQKTPPPISAEAPHILYLENLDRCSVTLERSAQPPVSLHLLKMLDAAGLESHMENI